MLCALAFICLNGKVVNALSMGDDEAMALGVNSMRMKMQLIAAATLACSLTVVMAGVINWIGLVIPHVMLFYLRAGQSPWPAEFSPGRRALYSADGFVHPHDLDSGIAAGHRHLDHPAAAVCL